MPQITISDRDVSTLRNALYVAAERFHGNAVRLRCQLPQIARDEKENRERCRLFTSGAVEHLAQRFDEQELEALSLAKNIR
jgi:hypothetical protein